MYYIICWKNKRKMDNWNIHFISKKNKLYNQTKHDIIILFNLLHYNILIYHSNLVFVGKGTIDILYQLYAEIFSLKMRFSEVIKHDRNMNVLFKDIANKLIDNMIFD